MNQNLPKSIRYLLTLSMLALVAGLAACTTDISAPEHTKPVASTAVNPATMEVLTTFPSGSFLENLEVQADGRVLITNYFSKTIESVTSKGEKSTFAALSGYPVSLISIADGYLVNVQTVNFMSGEPGNVNKFLLLDKSGKEVGEFDATGSAFLNGMVRLENGDILVADSFAATIWKVDINAQKLTPWLQHQLFAADPENQPNIPGVNGLKVSSKGLVVSNTAQGSLFLIKTDQNSNATSEPELLAKTGIIDDFWVNADDSIIFTTHKEELKSLSVDGLISDVLTKGCNGCTAVSPFPLGQSNTFVFIGDGGLFFGEKTPSTVSVVTLR